MPVLAPLRPLFEAITAQAPGGGPANSPAEARATVHAMMEAHVLGFYARHPKAPSEVDHRVPVDGGEIVVRIYAPDAGAAPLPCHLYIHGGSFWLGTLDQFASVCRGIVEAVGCAVASVGYRLAPEHRFPAAPEDCYAALRWVADHADQLGIDKRRLSVGGVSAGGNLAAATALMARDRGGPALALQVLELPITDLTRAEPLPFVDEGLTLASDQVQVRERYLAAPSDATHPYASPLLAPDLSNLPPALVMCAEYDPLRPEGDAYARRLVQAGVPVEYRCWYGQFHGSQPMAALIPEEAAAYEAQITQALRWAYASPA